MNSFDVTCVHKRWIRTNGGHASLAARAFLILSIYVLRLILLKTSGICKNSTQDSSCSHHLSLNSAILASFLNMSMPRNHLKKYVSQSTPLINKDDFGKLTDVNNSITED